MVTNFIGFTQVNLRRDTQLSDPLEILFGHAVLSAGTKVPTPANSATASGGIPADIAEVEASLEGMVAVGIVVDHVFVVVRIDPTA